MIARGSLLLMMTVALGTRHRHVLAFSVSLNTSTPATLPAATLTEVTATTGSNSSTPGYLTSPVLSISEVARSKPIEETYSTGTSTETVSPETKSNEIVTSVEVTSSSTSNEPDFSAGPVKKLYTTIYRNKSTDTTVFAEPITTTTRLIDGEGRQTATTTESPSPPTEQITSTSNDPITDVTDTLQVSETRNDLIKYETTKKETVAKNVSTTNNEVATEVNTQLVESTVNSTTELTTTTQQISDKSTVIQPTTIDGKKTSTLYAVKSTYKRPKKLEIVQPKPYLRDPNDNSWRNESISSLGIVFRPNDATNKTLTLVKNRTEVEPPAALPEPSPEPELKQRLDKLSSARRAGKRPQTPSVQHEYETEAPTYYYDGEVEEVTPTEDADRAAPGTGAGAGAELRAAEFFREFEALLDASTSLPPPPVSPTRRPTTIQYFPPSSVKHFRELVEEVRPEPFVPTFGQDSRGALYAALVRRLPPCEVRCGAGDTSAAVELSPDYELHYYIPEQEEQAAPPPHLAHPALALYTPRTLIAGT